MTALAMQPVAVHPHGLAAIGEHRGDRAISSGYGADTPPKPVVYEDVPSVSHASDQKFLKSEDLMFVRCVTPSLGDVHSVFMVCDGHMGAGAAAHCVDHLPGLLGQLLPQHLPCWHDESEVAAYAEQVRRGISSAVLLLDSDWGRGADMSGTTLTLAVISGWLLSVANTGDSNAIIDCGDDVKEITFSHRIQVNRAEQARLRQAGANLAPLGFHLQGPAKPQEMGVGPLRMWPGGLCVSRSIGDVDAGPLIIPLPHVRQVLLNRNRALRLMMASDGLWDLMSFSKAAKSVRHKLPDSAVSSLIQMVVRDRRMADDVTIIIADLLPPASPGATPIPFPASALKACSSGSSRGGSSGGHGGSSGSSSSGGSGGLFGRCFKSPAVVYDDVPAPPATPPPSSGSPSGLSAPAAALQKPWTGLAWMADVDCYEAYPVHGSQAQLARASVPAAGRPVTPPKRVGDFTVHGGQAHRFQQDSSWHTGASQHGGNNLPTFLSDEQVQALQAGGPAAAAGMVMASHSTHGGSGSTTRGGASGHGHGPTAQQQQQQGPGGLYAHQQQQQQQQQRVLPPANGTHGPAGGGEGPSADADRESEYGPGGRRVRFGVSSSSSSGNVGGGAGAPPPHHRSPPRPSSSYSVPFLPASGGGGGSTLESLGGDRDRDRDSSVHSNRSSSLTAGAPPAVGGGAGSATSGSLTRSASAVFEHDTPSGVYMAAEGAHPGGKAGSRAHKPAAHAHTGQFGSAPDAPLASAVSADPSTELPGPDGMHPSCGPNVFRNSVITNSVISDGGGI